MSKEPIYYDRITKEPITAEESHDRILEVAKALSKFGATAEEAERNVKAFSKL
jgi:hypothetical protein